MATASHEEPVGAPFPVAVEVAESIRDVLNCLPHLREAKVKDVASGEVVLELRGFFSRRLLKLQARRCQDGGGGIVYEFTGDASMRVRIEVVEGQPEPRLRVTVEADGGPLRGRLKELARGLARCLAARVASELVERARRLRVKFSTSPEAEELVNAASRGRLPVVSRVRARPAELGFESLLMLLTALATSPRDVFVVEAESKRLLGVFAYHPAEAVVYNARLTILGGEGVPSKTIHGEEAIAALFALREPALFTVYRGVLGHEYPGEAGGASVAAREGGVEATV